MKIVAIIGSPKSGAQSESVTLVNEFIDAIGKTISGIQIEIIELSQKRVLPCKGCCSCTHNGNCILDDDMEQIKQSMHGSDLMIFASPVHFNHVSSLFQNFIERMLLDLHTFSFIGKPIINVVTTNGSGEQDCDSYLTKTGYLMGAIKVGTLVRIKHDKFDHRNFVKLVDKSSRLLKGTITAKPTLMNKLYFQSMKHIIQKNPEYFKFESELWNRRNWFHKSYKQILLEKS